ncbi:MAG: hypothetical protein ACFFE8_07905 [Candidatus Heimdallarchaeota archaeon]
MFNQLMGGMDNPSLLIVFGSVIVIIIWLTTRKNKSKYIQQAQNLEERGQYMDALDLLARHSLEESAKLVLRSPEGSQVLALRRLESRFPSQKLERAFLRLARSNFAQRDPHAAAKAFVLAKKPFAAAKVFTDSGIDYVPAAIQVIDQNLSLIHDRDQAIRNLAKHAYNNQKFMEAAELLRTIGAEEEANAVLIAAATEMKQKGLDDVARQYVTSAGQSGVALQYYLNNVTNHLEKGEIEQMRRSLAIVKNISDNLPDQEKKIIPEQFTKHLKTIKEYERILKILDSARDILRKKETNQAIALYDELLDSLGTDTPTPILAEAGLANEETNPTYAAKLYRRAADRARSLAPQAAESFLRRANILVGSQVGTSNGVDTDFMEEVEEFCTVCRMPISENRSLVRCPECGSPAHYAHLAEWLKINAKCPICKNRIKITRPR